MSRAACTFRRRDLTAAVKAVVAAGVEVARVRVDRQGNIIVEAGKATAAPEPVDDLDRELAEFEAARGQG